MTDKQMIERKRHSQADIVSKLAEADAMIAQGKGQREVARVLGISIMTFHRWRKAYSRTPTVAPTMAPSIQPKQSSHAGKSDQYPVPEAHDRVAELQLENSRLRRLLTDVMLEKIKLEETDPRRFTSRELLNPAH